MAPVALNTTSIPAKTRQIILILLIILGFAIICALLGYCVATLTKFYRLHRREKERAKKILDIEARTAASNKEPRTPNASPIPTFPPTAYISPREKQVRIAVMAGWPVGIFDNVSRHADTALTSHLTCSSCGSPTNKSVSEAETLRLDGEIRQNSSSPNPPEEIDQPDSSITTKPISASVPRPSVDNSTPRILPVPPVVAKMMNAPPSRYDIVRTRTITMNDRYPLIQSSSKRGAAAPSSGKLQLHTAAGDATMNATLQMHKFPTSKSEGSVLNTRKGRNAPGPCLLHAKAHNHLS